MKRMAEAGWRKRAAMVLPLGMYGHQVGFRDKEKWTGKTLFCCIENVVNLIFFELIFWEQNSAGATFFFSFQICKWL